MIRAIIFKGSSQYATLRVFADELCKAFNNCNIEAVTVDLVNKEWLNILQKEINKGCSFFIGFNGVGIDLKTEDKNIYDVLNVPFINILMDHPYHHIERLSEKTHKYIVTTVDRNHLKFLDNFFEKDDFIVKTFLPHGGIKSESLNYNRAQFQARNNNILYTGTLKTEVKKLWHDLNNTYFKNLIEDVFNAKTKYMSIDEAVYYVLNKRGTIVRKKELSTIINYCTTYIDGYETPKNRWEIIEFLCENNIEVDAYGNGQWSELSRKYKNIHYHGNIDLNNLIDLYTKYKITINDNNNFSHGSHDRVFNALSNGCLCITANSKYYEEIFPQDFLNTCEYQRNDMENFGQKLYNAKKNDYLYEELVPMRKYSIENHLWKNRAEKIMEIYNIASV